MESKGHLMNTFFQGLARSQQVLRRYLRKLPLRLVVMEAFMTLLYVGIMSRVLGFDSLYSHSLKDPRLSREIQSDFEQIDVFQSCIDAVQIACLILPWRALCLPRSFTICSMLKRRNFPAKIVIGVEGLSLRPHAWVECGETAIDTIRDTQEGLVKFDVAD